MYRVSHFITAGRKTVPMSTDVETIAEAFDIVRALIQSNKLVFVNQEKTIDEWFCTLAAMAPHSSCEAHPTKVENFMFSVETVKDAE